MRELSFALIMIATPCPVSAVAVIRASKPSSRPLWLNASVCPVPERKTPSPSCSF